MKKYILGLTIMALVVFASAFTHPRSVQKSPTTTYWFLMDSQGNVTTTQVSDPNTLCPLAGDGCAREYDASQTEIVNGVRQVKPDQVNLDIASKAKP